MLMLIELAPSYSTVHVLDGAGSVIRSCSGPKSRQSCVSIVRQNFSYLNCMIPVLYYDQYFSHVEQKAMRTRMEVEFALFHWLFATSGDVM